MSIQRAEELKREWTDRHVVIRRGVPELQRFDGLIGQVRTVNMNCRLLIEFDTPADISWYDIDPQFVTVVESVQAPPSSDESVDGAKHSQAAAAAAASVKSEAQGGVSVTAASAGLSPLEQIRKQAAAAATMDSPTEHAAQQVTAAASPPADSPKKSTAVNPLDQIRRQAAAGTASPAAPTTDEGAAAPAPVTDPVSDDASAAAAPVAAGSIAHSFAITSVRSNPFDQIRAQAVADSAEAGDSRETQTIFDQVRVQAAKDELSTV
jgi:hypothetical protein